MATYKELMEQKAALEAQLESVRANELPGVIDQIHSLMAEFGLTAEDLAPQSKRGRPAKAATRPKAEPLPPKYMDPKTGKTWSGRGRAPAWLGKRPERFLIQEGQE